MNTLAGHCTTMHSWNISYAPQELVIGQLDLRSLWHTLIKVKKNEHIFGVKINILLPTNKSSVKDPIKNIIKMDNWE